MTRSARGSRQTCGLRVAHVGLWPPPYGGVSVHLTRLRRFLTARNVEFHVFDWSGRTTEDKESDPTVHVARGPYLLRAVRILAGVVGRRWDVVHLHVSSGKRFVWMGAPLLRLARGYKVVTIHSSYLLDLDRTTWTWRMVRVLLRDADHIVSTNRPVAEYLREHVAPDLAITIAPAFIPPTRAEAGAVSETVRELVGRLRRRFPRLLIAAGVPRPNWGLLRAVELMERLAPEYGLILVGYNAANTPYEAATREAAARSAGRVTFLTDLTPTDFVHLLANSDVFLRPTDTDGDSVALREALALGVPVVASDRIVRPSAARLYPIDDTEEFARQVVEAASAGSVPSDEIAFTSAEVVWDIYRRGSAAGGDIASAESD